MSDCRVIDDLNDYETQQEALGDLDEEYEKTQLLTDPDGQAEVYEKLKDNDEFMEIIYQLMESQKNQPEKYLAGMSMRIIEAIESVAGKIVEGM